MRAETQGQGRFYIFIPGYVARSRNVTLDAARAAAAVRPLAPSVGVSAALT